MKGINLRNRSATRVLELSGMPQSLITMILAWLAQPTNIAYLAGRERRFTLLRRFKIRRVSHQTSFCLAAHFHGERMKVLRTCFSR